MAKIGDLGDAPIIPIGLILAGLYLAWFGVHYWRRDLAWPSDPVKSVLQGHGLPKQGSVETSAAILTSVQEAAGSSGTVTTGAPSGTIGPGVAAAQKWASEHLADYGWDQSQMVPLISLWNRESGWQWNATNPQSGAYGIPQSLPADKMASEGSDWKTNPVTQMRWGLKYIKSVYGSPAGAWAHEQTYNWY